MSEKTFREVEDLQVYLMRCDLHIEVCECASAWPKSEMYELGSQVRRSSNSSPSQLAEKHDDRRWPAVREDRPEYGEILPFTGYPNPAPECLEPGDAPTSYL